MNLKYKEVKENVEDNLNSYFYEAEDVNDLEIYNRICIFIKQFLKVINEKLINPWIIILIKKFSNVGENYPRIGSTYSALSVIEILKVVYHENL